jgi:GTPase SAR1 family protein
METSNTNHVTITEVKDPTGEIEDYFFKIVVVGDSAVGKSNILTRYVQNEFNKESKSTVGVELSTKLYKINEKFIKVHLWDTAGIIIVFYCNNIFRAGKISVNYRCLLQRS